MRGRLILLISEHPIQQGIRKGGCPYFRLRTRTERTRTDRMAYSRQLDSCLGTEFFWINLTLFILLSFYWSQFSFWNEMISCSSYWTFHCCCVSWQWSFFAPDFCLICPLCQFQSIFTKGVNSCGKVTKLWIFSLQLGKGWGTQPHYIAFGGCFPHYIGWLV